MSNGNIFTLLSKQIPEFVRVKYPIFTLFMKYYYQFLSTKGFANISELQDIDFYCRGLTIDYVPWLDGGNKPFYHVDEIGNYHLVYGWNESKVVKEIDKFGVETGNFIFDDKVLVTPDTKSLNDYYIFNDYNNSLIKFDIGEFDGRNNHQHICTPIIDLDPPDLKPLVGHTLIEKLPDNGGYIRASVVGVSPDGKTLLIRYLTKDAEFTSRVTGLDNRIQTLGSLVFVKTSENISNTLPEMEVVKNMPIPNVFMDNFRYMLDSENTFFGHTDMINDILKNIKDYYRIKGNANSVDFLLRVMRGAEASIKYPWNNTLTISDGKWVQHYSIVIKVENRDYIDNLLRWYERRNNQNEACYINLNNYEMHPGVSRTYSVYRIETFNEPKNKNFVRLYLNKDVDYKLPPNPYYDQNVTNYITYNDIEPDEYFEGSIVYDVSKIDIVNPGRFWFNGQIFKIGGQRYRTQYLDYDIQYTPWFFRKLAYLKRSLKQEDRDKYSVFITELKTRYPNEYSHISDNIEDSYVVNEEFADAGERTHLQISPIMYGESGLSDEDSYSTDALIGKVENTDLTTFNDEGIARRGITSISIIQNGEYLCGELTPANFDEDGNFIEYTKRDEKGRLIEPKVDTPQGVIDHAAWTVSEHYKIRPFFVNSSEDLDPSVYEAEVKFGFALVQKDDGHWGASKGLLSDNNIYLHDSFYYQKFSYDIMTSIRPEDYESFIEAIHPAGTLKFYTYNKFDYYNMDYKLHIDFPLKSVHIVDTALMLDHMYKKINKRLYDEIASFNELWNKTFKKSLQDEIETKDILERRSNQFTKALGVLRKQEYTVDIDGITNRYVHVFNSGLCLSPATEYVYHNNTFENLSSTRLILRGNIIEDRPVYIYITDTPYKSSSSEDRSDVIPARTPYLVPEHVKDSASLLVFCNGVLLRKDVHYTDESLSTIKFNFDLRTDYNINVVVSEDIPTIVYGDQYNTLTSGQVMSVQGHDMGDPCFMVFYRGLLCQDVTREYIDEQSGEQIVEHISEYTDLGGDEISFNFDIEDANEVTIYKWTKPITKSTISPSKIAENDETIKVNEFNTLQFKKYLYSNVENIEELTRNALNKRFFNEVEVKEVLNDVLFNKQLTEFSIEVLDNTINSINKMLSDRIEVNDPNVLSIKKFLQEIIDIKIHNKFKLSKNLSSNVEQVLDRVSNKFYRPLQDEAFIDISKTIINSAKWISEHVPMSDYAYMVIPEGMDHNTDDVYDSIVVRKAVEGDTLTYRDYCCDKWLPVDPNPTRGSNKNDELQKMFNDSNWFSREFTEDARNHPEINNTNYGIPNTISLVVNTDEYEDAKVDPSYGERYI